MPQLEHIPSGFKEVAKKDARYPCVALRTEGEDVEFDFTFKALRPNVFRVTFSSETHPLPPYPSVREPDADISGVSISESSNSPSHKCFQIGDVTAAVDWTDTPVVSLSWTGSKERLHSDVAFRSYVADGEGVAHYTQHDRNALHVGLGEQAAPFDLTARGFRIDATDSFGYEVYKTNPLYKHMPFLVKATPEGCVGIVSASHSRGFWAVGSEIDGLWGHFKVYRQDYGGLEEFLIVGKTMKEVVRSYAELVGFPLLAPRWAYGYLSGGYKYTMSDDPPAYQGLIEFAEKLKEHDIPCSGHQMSSGYSIAEVEPKVRNVFTWNKHRFPNPEEWIAKYHAMGIRLMTNIKPFVLASHPDYQYLESSRALFTDPRRKGTATMRLWSAGGGESGAGGHIDFTSKAGYEWWRKGVRNLKLQGIDAMWNDNNEYTLPNDNWQMSLENVPSGRAVNKVGLWGRAIHTELMGKASYDGLLDAEPGVRPFVLTRSASIGTLRFCCSSWSGDNMTSWEGMKGANALSLTAGICLMHCYGHDIGGFEGPQPSPELLLRWVQLGIYGPRFAINCFKTSPQDNTNGEVIEPWMYPETTHLIRKAIKRRYEIMPYIYSLALESHLTASPPQRWVGWGYESDPEVWSQSLKRGEEQFWFGDTLLVGGVYEPGVSQARVYLPRRGGTEFDYGYVNLHSPYQYFAAGQWVTITSEWQNSIPVLAKIGGAIPVGKNLQTRMSADMDPASGSLEEDDYRGMEIFPPRGSSHGTIFSASWYEDDGMSVTPEISVFTIHYGSTEETVTVQISPNPDNTFVPAWRHIVIILPHEDGRQVISAGGGAVSKLDTDLAGRARFRLPA